MVSEEDGKWLCSRKEKWWNFFLPPVLVWMCATDGPLISVVEVLLSLKVFFKTVTGRCVESSNLTICFHFLQNLRGIKFKVTKNYLKHTPSVRSCENKKLFFVYRLFLRLIRLSASSSFFSQGQFSFAQSIIFVYHYAR